MKECLAGHPLPRGTWGGAQIWLGGCAGHPQAMGGRRAASYPIAISASIASNLKVFFDMEIGSQPTGRIVMELYTDTTPCTTVNFCALYTGEKGIGHSGSNEYQFFICTTKIEWFDGKHMGLDIVKEIEKVGSSSRRIAMVIAGRPHGLDGVARAWATPLAQLGGHPHELGVTTSRPTPFGGHPKYLCFIFF